MGCRLWSPNEACTSGPTPAKGTIYGIEARSPSMGQLTRAPPTLREGQAPAQISAFVRVTIYGMPQRWPSMGCQRLLHSHPGPQRWTFMGSRTGRRLWDAPNDADGGVRSMLVELIGIGDRSWEVAGGNLR